MRLKKKRSLKMTANTQIQGINNAIEQKKKEHNRNLDNLKKQKDREKQNYERRIQNLKNQKQYYKDTKKAKADSSYKSYVSASNVVECLNREIKMALNG